MTDEFPGSEANSITMMMPAFSVIMPAFNAASTVGTAVESVLKQTRDDFELLVVDDGSTDETLARARRYLADGRVRVLSQPNGGQAVARNSAIAVACGTYISLLDSDDAWLPQYLETMGGILDSDPEAAVAFTDAWVLDDETRRIARKTAMKPFYPPSLPQEPERFLRALLEFGNFVFVGATIRRSALEAIGPFRVGVEGSEDYELWLRLAAHGYRFVRCPRTLAIYRKSEGQVSAKESAMRRAGNAVFDIVADEYDLPDDLLDLARRRLPMRYESRHTRRVPRFLRSAYKAVSTIRRFHVIPPPEVRRAFPDLHQV